MNNSLVVSEETQSLGWGTTILIVMTLSIMTLSIITLSIMTLSIMTLSIMTLNIMAQHKGLFCDSA